MTRVKENKGKGAMPIIDSFNRTLVIMSKPGICKNCAGMGKR